MNPNPNATNKIYGFNPLQENQNNMAFNLNGNQNMMYNQSAGYGFANSPNENHGIFVKSPSNLPTNINIDQPINNMNVSNPLQNMNYNEFNLNDQMNNNNINVNISQQQNEFKVILLIEYINKITFLGKNTRQRVN